MKGVIAVCLSDLIKEKFGKEKWEAVLEKAGLKKTTFFMPSTDIEDAAVLNLVEAVCQVLGLTITQAADAFGEYWVTVYAPKIYKIYYKGKNSAREFLLEMDKVHQAVTEKIPNAKPPHFTYKWQDDHTLLMTYKSSRGLMVFFSGLVKGVGKYFNENLNISQVGTDQLKIVFP